MEVASESLTINTQLSQWNGPNLLAQTASPLSKWEPSRPLLVARHHPPLLKFQRFQSWDQSLRENGHIRTFSVIKSYPHGSCHRFKPPQQADSLVTNVLRCEGLIRVLYPSPPGSGLTPKNGPFATVEREPLLNWKVIIRKSRPEKNNFWKTQK